MELTLKYFHLEQPDNQVGRLCYSWHLYLVEVRVLVIFGTLFSFELISLDLRTEKSDLYYLLSVRLRLLSSSITFSSFMFLPPQTTTNCHKTSDGGTHDITSKTFIMHIELVVVDWRLSITGKY